MAKLTLRMHKEVAPQIVEEPIVAPVVETAHVHEHVHAHNPCKEFLQSFLSGGPIMRTNVYREADNQNLMWEDVRQAFAELNGREYVQRGEYFWRLMPE